MKKIGILTFHRAVNYGAVLQSYALSKAIQKLGGKAEIIDYRNEHIELGYTTKPSKQLSIKQNVKNILFARKQDRRNKQFDDFRKNYINTSSTVYNRNDNLYCIENEYDSIIVGSDQVWNYACIAGDKTFLLDFIKEQKKKYSYAASLGKMNTWQLSEMKLDQYVISYNTVSVREESGKKLLNEYGVDTRIDVDPTILLSKSEWQEITTGVMEKDYCLLYSVDLPDNVLSCARKYAKKNNLKLVVITLNNKYRALNNEIDRSCCSPRDFLGYINEAKLVITNSFHGTVFSIIFNKNFVTVKNELKGMDNSRLDTLLGTLGLKNRHIISDIPEENINYELVEKKKKLLVENSMDYLRDIVVGN